METKVDKSTITISFDVWGAQWFNDNLTEAYQELLRIFPGDESTAESALCNVLHQCFYIYKEFDRALKELGEPDTPPLRGCQN